MIEFEVRWLDPAGEKTSVDAGTRLAWGAGLLKVNGSPVWFSGPSDEPSPIVWSWIELLEFLAANWVHLLTEQHYPLGITPLCPQHLRAELNGRFELYGNALTTTQQDAMDELVFMFEDRHDLSRALRGISVTSLMLVREGSHILIQSPEGAPISCTIDALKTDLERIANQILNRIQEGVPDARSTKAMQAWNERNNIAPRRLVLMATGMKVEDFSDAVPNADLAFWELEGGPGSDSEISAAARFSQGTRVSAEDRLQILQAIKSQPAVETTALDELSERLKETLALYSGTPPWEQGCALGRKLRDFLGVEDQSRAEPEAVLQSLGVSIIEVDVSPDIDAVGCWGPRHGPAVVVNTSGKRAQVEWGRRATFAHELCHLMIDRHGALPLAEVLGGKAPLLIEKRANAFAAEFLLPAYAVNSVYKKLHKIEETLHTVCDQYGVGKVLAANQLRHHPNLDGYEKSYLKDIIENETFAWDFY